MKLDLLGDITIGIKTLGDKKCHNGDVQICFIRNKFRHIKQTADAAGNCKYGIHILMM